MKSHKQQQAYRPVNLALRHHSWITNLLIRSVLPESLGQSHQLLLTIHHGDGRWGLDGAETCSFNLAGVSHLHVRLLTAAGTPCAFPVTEHAAHALHLRWRQTLVQLGLPSKLMILLIYGAIPSAGQLVQLWDGTSVIIPRRVLLRFGAARGLVSPPPVDANLVSLGLVLNALLTGQVNACSAGASLFCRQSNAHSTESCHAAKNPCSIRA